ncbi:zinc carboxypeptidase-like [Babylonia areolata]|uniref:zinc carboxypeptidase-like n=1 Tax=Babylonia areolata TaxID=304850 RepID=UPI003FCF5E37
MMEALESQGMDYTMGTPFQVLGYAASGGSFDWALQEKPGIYSYCYELRPRFISQGHFILHPDYIVPTGEEVLRSLLVLSQNI